MRHRSMTLTFPELGLIAGTRGLLGFGLGLLLADHLTLRQRRRLAWPALLIGALSSIPILIHLFRKSSADVPRHAPAEARESELAGEPSGRIV
jgi:hypothetical protein